MKINPNITPPTVIRIRVKGFISASGFSIQIPGNVKAKPPATIAPADIAVWVTFISLIFVFPHAFNANMETSATNIIGHGKELSFKATNIELMVRIIAPALPIINPLAVSCSL
ncbi:hypothetical protein SDC9_180538 [bioreactor metagenome]|uniref:Uncharacterized protein n=1 Tax=bioreactor metagenome TaxID=1076179 RepID=A0A645H206_9ZZZZ